MPIRVSKEELIFCMKKSVLGLGTGWPLHVQLYPNRQVSLGVIGLTTDCSGLVRQQGLSPIAKCCRARLARFGAFWSLASLLFTSIQRIV
jgi:hypothetical protein